MGGRCLPDGIRETTGNGMMDKPLPIMDEDSEAFWDAARLGKLRIKRCAECGKHHFFPRAICPHCHSDAVNWVKAKGTGTVYSYTVARRAAGPAFKDDVPYAIALVELDEGPRMMARIAADPQKVRIGAPVAVIFEAISPEVTLPLFRLTGAD